MTTKKVTIFNILKEENAWRNLYSGLCYGLCEGGIGTVINNVLLIFGELDRVDLSYEILGTFFIGQTFANMRELFFNIINVKKVSLELFYHDQLPHMTTGPFIFSLIPSLKRHRYLATLTMIVVFQMVTVMNACYCNLNTQHKELGGWACSEDFIQASVLIASFMGGFCLGVNWLIRAHLASKYCKPYTKCRFNAMFQIVFQISWILGLFITTKGFFGNYYNSVRLLTIYTTISIPFFIYLKPAVSEEEASKELQKQRRKLDEPDPDQQLTDTTIESISEYTAGKEWVDIIDKKARTFTQERLLVQSINSHKELLVISERVGRNVDPLCQFKLRRQEFFKFLRHDKNLRYLISTYILQSMCNIWWIFTTMYILKSVQNVKKQQNLEYDDVESVDFILQIQIIQKCFMVLFFYIWGNFYDTAVIQRKKLLFGIFHFFIPVYLLMTFFGYGEHYYTYFYFAALFYSWSVAGFQIVLGPMINEIYGPDERKRLYARCVSNFFTNLTKSVCYMYGAFIIQLEIRYIFFMFIPFWIVSGYMIFKKIEFKPTKQ